MDLGIFLKVGIVLVSLMTFPLAFNLVNATVRRAMEKGDMMGISRPNATYVCHRKSLNRSHINKSPRVVGWHWWLVETTTDASREILDLDHVDSILTGRHGTRSDPQTLRQAFSSWL